MNPASEREAVLTEYDVSRETSARLDLLVVELARWQTIKNLVAARTVSQVWSRHIADSLQLLTIAPDASRWLDLGSGAGFPGLVIAAALADKEADVHLVERNGRKCAFLRHVARRSRSPCHIHEAALEEVINNLAGRFDVVTARALAPLSQLLDWTEQLLKTGTVALFPKGRGFEAELTEAAKAWRFSFDLIPSRTDPEGRVVRIRSVYKRG